MTALAKFGAACPDLLASIVVLLRRCTLDTDDEVVFYIKNRNFFQVRDRAAYYVHVLEQSAGNQTALNAYILGSLQVSLSGLERQLAVYCAQGPQVAEFDLKTVPVAAQAITVMETKERPAVAEPTVVKGGD